MKSAAVGDGLGCACVRVCVYACGIYSARGVLLFIDLKQRDIAKDAQRSEICRVVCCQGWCMQQEKAKNSRLEQDVGLAVWAVDGGWQAWQKQLETAKKKWSTRRNAKHA
ncbi:uncharacterized protein MONOS_13671 [Monocercomonoides exilis]|uniref:uncharacterized protein n=1 Tax=Monocercomonoides exilis TaxID=2049356 RepID=UPI00355A6E5E|nr:hypothetical protein MONOS_13671 [Monocercomonoides exilis]|eukprot:MONOS_13671.1-p1 / transcript=MONOS_13671.1 / gene=MONOS_13671 / organism=Monocercomonoides_exilis_PA203 / gene_product=unspecified product / transcript_product=unspecified product / location=Mono_scaffold00861:24559-25064(-) / protein_length=110 / sequence_SO=supercontig / SO=protein_coding / is_pseudo=false